MCRVCNRNESENKCPKKHNCYRNWKGRSKGVEADKSEVLKYYRINKDNKLYSLLGTPLSGCCTVEALNKIEQQGRERANVNNRIKKTSVRNHLKMI